MKNLHMFGLGEANSLFLYQQKPSHNPGDIAYTDNGEKKVRESSTKEIEDGTGSIENNKKEVKKPWDTASQNILRKELAKEIEEAEAAGITIDAVIAKAGNTLGQIAFGMKNVENGANVGWGTEVVYIDKDKKEANRVVLAKANALKPGWRVSIKKNAEETVYIEVIMDTETTAAQLIELKDKVTKNIESDKEEAPVETEAPAETEAPLETEAPVEEEKEEEKEEGEPGGKELIDQDDAFLEAFTDQLVNSSLASAQINEDRVAGLAERGHENPMVKNGKVRVQNGHFLPGWKKTIVYKVKGAEVSTREWLDSVGREDMTEDAFEAFVNKPENIKKIQEKINKKTNVIQTMGSKEEGKEVVHIDDGGVSPEVVVPEQSEEVKEPSKRAIRLAKRILKGAKDKVKTKLFAQLEEDNIDMSVEEFVAEIQKNLPKTEEEVKTEEVITPDKASVPEKAEEVVAEEAVPLEEVKEPSKKAIRLAERILKGAKDKVKTKLRDQLKKENIDMSVEEFLKKIQEDKEK